MRLLPVRISPYHTDYQANKYMIHCSITSTRFVHKGCLHKENLVTLEIGLFQIMDDSLLTVLFMTGSSANTV